MVNLSDIEKMDEEDDIEGIILALRDNNNTITEKAASVLEEKSNVKTQKINFKFNCYLLKKMSINFKNSKINLK